MKGGLVAMLYGAAAARELGLLGDRRILLHCVCDEETGSVAGSGHLRAAGLIDPGALAMVTAEPTGGVVWHAEPRRHHAPRRRARPAAHVGQAHLGVNAFEHMVRVAEPLAALAHDLLARRTAYAVGTEEARGSMLVVGGASGSGANFNVVPGAAWFSVDRRFDPEEDLDEELAQADVHDRDAAARAGAEVRVTVLQRQPSAATDARHPAAAALARCVEEVEGAARRAARRLPWPRRVHRRGGDAPLRRRPRAVRGRGPGVTGYSTPAGTATGSSRARAISPGALPARASTRPPGDQMVDAPAVAG